MASKLRPHAAFLSRHLRGGIAIKLFPIDSTIPLANVRYDLSAIIRSNSFLCARAPKENIAEIELISNEAKLNITLRNIA